MNRLSPSSGRGRLRVHFARMVKHHVLPEDPAAGIAGDTSWFVRLSPFVQTETRRQVRYRRTAWPDLPPLGEYSKRRGYLYPHILPPDSWQLNIYEPIRT